MIKRINGLIVSLLLLSNLTACSSSDGKRILGHWRADRIQVQSISLPMGPEFFVMHQELLSADGDIRIPISSIQSEGDVVTLGAPFGIGLSFYFESADRIYFDMPLAGRVYFHRVTDSVQPARANPAPQAIAPAAAPAQVPAAAPAPVIQALVAPPVTQTPAPQPAMATTTVHGASTVDLIRQAELMLASNALSEADALLGQARRQYGDHPMIDYNLAVLRMRQGDQDGSVRSLRDAFEHGFRDFSLLNTSTEFAPLKRDPRYNALMTRYQY